MCIVNNVMLNCIAHCFYKQGSLRLADNDGNSKSIVSRHGRSLHIDEENPVNLRMVNTGLQLFTYINNL